MKRLPNSLFSHKQSEKTDLLNQHNVKAFFYKLPLIKQKANECWLCAAAMSCSRNREELRENFIAIAEEVKKGFGENALTEFKEKGIVITLEPQYRELLQMHELPSDHLKNENISMENKYNYLKELLAEHGPLVFKMQSPFSNFIHEHVLSGVMIGPKSFIGENDMFLLVNASCSEAHPTSYGAAKLDALPLRGFVFGDPDYYDAFKIYTSPRKYKKIIELRSEKEIIDLLKDKEFGDMLIVPDSIANKIEENKENSCTIL